MKKKVMSLLLVGAMVLSLAACGTTTSGDESSSDESSGSEESSESTEASSEGSGLLENGRYAELRVAAATDFGDLEPDIYNTDPRFYMINDIYECLFDMADDSSGTYTPCMATGYEEISDTQWLITLHDDIYDWEGNNITADDVKFSFDWLVDSGNAIRFDYFDSIEVIDDYSFYMNWTEPLPALAEVEMPLSRVFIFSQKAYEEKGNFTTDPVGTGCYTITEFTPGSKLVMEANDDWWGMPYIDEMEGRHRANVQTLTFETVAEAATAVVGLETGTLDLCGYVPLAMMDEFETGEYSDKYDVITITSGDFWYFGPNPNSVNEDLRKAIFYALDGDAIAEAMGGSYVSMNSFGTSYYTDWDDSLIMDGTYITEYDEDLAKEYLDKSGYNGEELTLICLSSEEATKAAQMVQVELQQIGINLTINAVTQDIYGSVVVPDGSDQWDIAMSSIGGGNMVGAWHLLFDNEVNGGVTTTLIDDPELQDLYNEAKADETHDAEHMRACMDYIVDNAYMYPLVSISNAIVYTNDITELYFREGYYYPSASTFK